MGLLKRWSLASRLSLLALATLVPIALLTIVTFDQVRTEKREEQFRQASDYSQSLANALDNFAQGIQTFALAAAVSLGSSNQPITQETSSEYLRLLTNQYGTLLRAIFVTDLNGRVIATQTGQDSGTDLSSRPYIQALQKGSETVWSGGLVGVQSGQVTVAYGRVILTEDKTPRGYLIAAFYPVNLSDALAQDLAPDANIVMIDQNGQLLFSARDPNVERTIPDLTGDSLVQQVMSGESVTFEDAKTPFDQDERYGRLVPMRNLGWSLGYTRSRSTLDSSVTNKMLESLAILAVIGALSIGAATLVAKQMTRPLARLAAAAADIGAGRMPAPQPTQSDPDLAKLELAFADMAASIQQREDELREANEAKDEFLGLVSHELRTPTTTIYGGLRLLTGHRNLDEDLKAELMDDILSETDRMVRLIENLLAFARMEMGRDIDTGALDPAEFVQSGVDSFLKTRPLRHVQIDMEPDKLSQVQAEPTYCEQVLTNLLTNADKYSPAEEPIEVEVHTEGQMVSVSVSDHGPGVPAGEIDRIFESFYRSAQTSATSPGHGLGLTVCRRLVEKMGGTIGAVNRPEGGLCVTFTMPVAAPLATGKVDLVYGVPSGLSTQSRCRPATGLQ